ARNERNRGAAREWNRQNVVGELGLRGAEKEGIFRAVVGGSELLGFIEVRAGRAVRVDDSFREKIPDGLAVLGLVGSKDVIERAVFTDDHDDMLDGRACAVPIVLVIVVIIGHNDRRTDRKLEQSNGHHTGAQAPSNAGSKMLESHATSSCFS